MKLRNNLGFTLVEILVVITIIGILVALGNSVLGKDARKKTLQTRATSELTVMANAVKLYVAKYNEYPEDTTRDVPAGIKEFIDKGQSNEEWPDAPWPGSVYDYENWDNGDTIQISIRFCPSAGAATSTCTFPEEEWAENFDSYSSVYYCIDEKDGGQCRAHESQPPNHPGYCINCDTKVN